jgi:hypothetical protein
MNTFTTSRRVLPALGLAVLASLAACDASGDPAVPDPSADAPVVVAGQLFASPAGGQGAAAATSSSPDLSGITVAAEGDAASDVTDASGRFRLETRARNGRIRLRFRRGALDADIDLQGVQAGGMVQVDVTLDVDGVSVTADMRGHHHEFEGEARILSVTGEAPTRIMQLAVARHGRRVLVDVFEHRTEFDPRGDLTTFAELGRALRAGTTTLVEGEGLLRADALILAATLKAETREDDHGGRD